MHLDASHFIDLAKQLSGIEEPEEVVFENDKRGHLLRVQVWGAPQSSNEQRKQEP